MHTYTTHTHTQAMSSGVPVRMLNMIHNSYIHTCIHTQHTYTQAMSSGVPVQMLNNPKFSKKAQKLMAILAAGAAGGVVGGPLGCLAAMCCMAFATAGASAVKEQNQAGVV